MVECSLVIILTLVRPIVGNSKILISSEGDELYNDTIVIFTDIVKENKQYPPFTDICSLRIIGGFEAPIQYAPYQIALKTSYNYGRYWDTFCGGSLVTLRHVLTAAHCFISYKSQRSTSSVRVVAGTIRTISRYDTYGAESWRRVKSLWIHENYNFQTVVNDIAVIEVDRAFMKSRETQPIRLHSFGMSVNTSAGVHCAITGFGLRDRYRPSPLLRMACVPLISDIECLMYYTRYLRSSNICAGDRTKDSCQGDSGGPLVCGGVQVGVVSFGGRCAESPGVYTRVVSYTDGPVLFILTKDGCEALRAQTSWTITLGLVCLLKAILVNNEFA